MNKPQSLLLIAGLLLGGSALATPSAENAAAVAPAAMTYYPPAIVIDAPRVRPYALVAAPTLPCAPRYCRQLRPRRDRN